MFGTNFNYDPNAARERRLRASEVATRGDIDALQTQIELLRDELRNALAQFVSSGTPEDTSE